jgi:hypothetical protein
MHHTPSANCACAAQHVAANSSFCVLSYTELFFFLFGPITTCQRCPQLRQCCRQTCASQGCLAQRRSQPCCWHPCVRQLASWQLRARQALQQQLLHSAHTNRVVPGSMARAKHQAAVSSRAYTGPTMPGHGGGGPQSCSVILLVAFMICSSHIKTRVLQSITAACFYTCHNAQHPLHSSVVATSEAKVLQCS